MEDLVPDPGDSPAPPEMPDVVPAASRACASLRVVLACTNMNTTAPRMMTAATATATTT